MLTELTGRLACGDLVEKKALSMSYEAARHYLSRCRDRAEVSGQEPELLGAVEELAAAVETDMVQIKGALSQMASLLERINSALPLDD